MASVRKSPKVFSKLFSGTTVTHSFNTSVNEKCILENILVNQ